jgi:hypothetical protein
MAAVRIQFNELEEYRAALEDKLEKLNKRPRALKK